MGIVLATIAVDAVLGGFDALDVFDVAPPTSPGPMDDGAG